MIWVYTLLPLRISLATIGVCVLCVNFGWRIFYLGGEFKLNDREKLDSVIKDKGKRFGFLIILPKITTIVLGIMCFVMGCAFSGCSLSKEPSGNGVGSEINLVDNVYHEVYIEKGMTDSDKGLVVGLHDDAKDILESADAIYDGETELSFSNERIIGLSEKILGSTDNELKIVKGSKAYTLKYMYVTRAIRDTKDLHIDRTDFPSMPSYRICEKNSDYIFEMDIKSRSYAVQEDRIPTFEISGYFVLANDIDVGSTVYKMPGQKMYNIIQAGHEEYRYTDRKDLGFTGTFDGRGHVISNVTTWMGGLFGFINGGTIKNLAIINGSNYWQGRAKNIFADFSICGNFENIYVKLQEQGCDNGDIDLYPENYWYDLWASLISRGTVNAKNCVFESFVLQRGVFNNTNYMQFVDTEEGSTYQNVHCVGSTPLSLYKVNRGYSIAIAVTEKEMLEFNDRIYGDYVNYKYDLVSWIKYYSVMVATAATYVEFVEAPSGLEKYDTIDSFNSAMKNDSTSVQAFMDTGCWNFDSATGALTWKNI